MKSQPNQPKDPMTKDKIAENFPKIDERKIAREVNTNHFTNRADNRGNNNE